MNVIVCVKQIPDPALPGELDPSTNTLKRDGKLILDESDSYGVEMALQLVTAAGGGEVSLVSMAPNDETSGLRTALAMGAAKAVLVSDPSLAGADALTTAKVLAAASKKLGDVDLIIAGTESSDGYTGTVPEQIAEVLGLPSITFAKSIEITDGTLKVARQTEAGYDEVTCPLPAVVSVTAGVVEPRYPSFKGIMAAKSKPVETVTAGELGIESVSIELPGPDGERQAAISRLAALQPRLVLAAGSGSTTAALKTLPSTPVVFMLVPNAADVPFLAPGSADLVGLCITASGIGRFIALEIKTPTGRVPPEQVLCLALVRRTGGFAAVVRSVDEARAAVARCRAGGAE